MKVEDDPRACNLFHLDPFSMHPCHGCWSDDHVRTLGHTSYGRDVLHILLYGPNVTRRDKLTSESGAEKARLGSRGFFFMGS
ncbi:hypothetical protein C7445_104130 [Alicyclobacillus sacchari]|uniref:Uncharacterized protein n=1 Tax=Alicyclobacillus sacchari TaxID=392010 RepID=A0A4R8LQ14_9BACL|nr:hypothetical protein C7445_104130 [Alicyclobacillus sacchari]